ncbi:sensor histidine kinase [Bacillus suaedaesalsae]|uniref:histidine kinase n=1 Tax=Bacillus suaedaesalsae TaxID=2810349 RepID=A0ABS2DCI9_9BACI|nr:histidine kinase [Bacillus suaedaesalsae]MBM6616176.1 histidine kinase [Bacillus suaedaesalsae]
MNTIQRKIWLLTTVVLLIMAVIWVTLTYYNQKTQNQYNEILQRYLELNEVTVSSQQLVMDLNNYLILPSSTNLEQLINSKENIRSIKQKVYALRHEENDFSLTNYMNLIDSLIETTERALLFHSENETEASAKEFSEANRISTYISEMSLTLLDKEIKTYDRFYRGFIEQSVEIKKLGIWVMLLITLILLLVTYWFSLSITRPVSKLTQAANELSNGRFDLQIEVSSNDEISFLAKTFDRMRMNIINLISEIQEKADLERELQQNKLMLKESQLRTLQNQINPHFLFNTLNTLSKKAYLEGSEEMSDLLVSVADLLRYNLKRIDRSVTISDEVTVIKKYMDIQKARFTDRLQFYMEVDHSCLDYLIPSLTIQPIVENAVIHAIEPKEEGGSIWFRIIDAEELVLIEIEDDGNGISEQNIWHMLEETPHERENENAGIGFINVVKRIRIYYGIQDVIDIKSSDGQGTKITLKIPKTRGISYDDEALDSR